MSYIKASALSFLSLSFKLLATIFCTKIYVLQFGPELYGKIGNYLTLISLLTVLGGGGIANGIITVGARLRANEEQYNKFIANSFGLTVLAALLTTIVFSVFAAEISEIIFLDKDHKGLILILGLGQILIALSSFFVAFLKSNADVYRLTLVTIAVSCGSVLFFAASYYWKLPYTLTACGFILNGALYCLPFGRIAIRAITKASFLGIKDAFTNLRRFAAMSFISALTIPFALISARNFVATQYGDGAVGEWQAVFRLSELVVYFYSAFVSAYFLPRISQLKSAKDVGDEIRAAAPIIALPVVLYATMCSVFPIFVLNTFYSAEFEGAANLLQYQCMGDVARALALPFGYYFVAQKKIWIYAIVELIQSGGFLLLLVVMSPLLGLASVAISYLIVYCFVFLFLGALFTRRLIDDSCVKC